MSNLRKKLFVWGNDFIAMAQSAKEARILIQQKTGNNPKIRKQLIAESPKIFSDSYGIVIWKNIPVKM